jgi:hypothetical protein
MGGLERRIESLEAARMRREARPAREVLGHLSDEELEALEESLLAEARVRGEQPPPNEFLEKMKRWEAEATERQRRYTEESRRRGRELLERKHALIGTRQRSAKKGARR